jgi:hypothetical protein
MIPANVIRAAGALAIAAAGFVLSAAPTGAGEIYGISDAGGRYVIRAIDPDRPATVRDVAALAGVGGGQLHGLLQLPDRRIAVVRDGTAARRELAVLGPPDQFAGIQTQTVTGIDPAASLSQLLLGWGSRWYALIGTQRDRPPFSIGVLAAGAGGFSLVSTIALPAQARYANLTQCPDGSIYALSFAPQQDARLVRVQPDSGEVSQLTFVTFNTRRLGQDALGTTCDAAGRLFVLADPTRAGTPSLFALDPASGTLTWLGWFPADRMTAVTP